MGFYVPIFCFKMLEIELAEIEIQLIVWNKSNLNKLFQKSSILRFSSNMTSLSGLSKTLNLSQNFDDMRRSSLERFSTRCLRRFNAAASLLRCRRFRCSTVGGHLADGNLENEMGKLLIESNMANYLGKSRKKNYSTVPYTPLGGRCLRNATAICILRC